MKVPMLFALSALFIGTLADCSAVTWTSADGKQITADFVYCDGANVVLASAGKQFTVPLSRLDDESSVRAFSLQRYITSLLDEPVLFEAEIRSVAALPQSNGKFFVIRGTVASVTRPGGLANSTLGDADITLEGGTLARVTFGEVNGRSTKATFELDKMVLTKATKIGPNGPSNFARVRTLVEAGNKILINAKVENGRVVPLGLAEEKAVSATKITATDARRDFVVPTAPQPGPSAASIKNSGTIYTPSGNYQWNRSSDGSLSVLGPPSTGLEPASNFTIRRDLSGDIHVDP